MDKASIEEVRRIMENEPPMLFLGAGFSLGATNEYGDIPLGDTLKQEIIDIFIRGNVDEEAIREIEHYELQDVCEFVDESLKQYTELREFLVKRLGNVKPAEFHYNLTNYPWKKIYTVNIDNLVEVVYRKSQNTLLVQNQAKQKTGDHSLEYMKLHGCVYGPTSGLVFSRKEYNDLISGRMNFKLNDLGHDIQRETFIFIGASMDEADIDSYIIKYEQAGYFRKGRMIFVDPKPKMKIRNRVNSFSGILLEWTTEQFMEFLDTVHYKPDELEKCIKRLNYSGIYLYNDIVNNIESVKTYESKLYEGYNCEWRDVLDGWLFESPYFEGLRKRMEQISYADGDTYCIALYGKGLVGKGCMLKQAGVWLDKKGYTVLEFRGKSLDYSKLFDFMRNDTGKRYALLIEDASFYYKIIERMFEENDTNKKLLILTTSRNYYHLKKRYYLEGNPYEEFEVRDKLDYKYAQIIYKKISEKGYLGELSREETKGCAEITRHKILSNLFIAITYGENFQKRVDASLNDLLTDYSEQGIRLFKELTLFEKVDVPYYPNEILTARYSIDFNCFNKDAEKISASEAAIVDFVRIDREGVSLKNKIILEQVWKLTTIREKQEIVYGILHYIAPYVSENDNNYWRVIFESLLKVDILIDKLDFGLKDILSLFYRLKEEYGDISYYWLQMGIAEQKKKDYVKALNHLKMANSIRPYAYQIQHAIARNYLKQANYVKDIAEADALFKIGEEKMLELINSHEHYKDKARNFSIHCYILEKIAFLNKYNRKISNDEIRRMKRWIDSILHTKDDYIKGLLKAFVLLLKDNNKVDMINFKPGDPYWNALNQQKMLGNDENDENDEDILVESY
ncbi:MAG: SIR2 family protein [Lachnospiraceae bacterium]|nr:SIR2 family protein [Butyrivibrio sp.]MCM1344068.1 SIR2 family protein [Muribaculaceae bacterium]MCM1408959.1 SIR2 family protein [Lachnospiraceae bacterium]